MADVSVSIVVDQALYTQIEQEAAEREQSPGEAIAQVLSDVYGSAARQAQASQTTQQPAPAAASVQPGVPPNFPPASLSESTGAAEAPQGVEFPTQSVDGSTTPV